MWFMLWLALSVGGEKALMLCDASMKACETRCERQYIETQTMKRYLECVKGCEDQQMRCAATVVGG